MRLRPTHIVSVVLVTACLIVSTPATSSKIGAAKRILSLFEGPVQMDIIEQSIRIGDEFTIKVRSKIDRELKKIGKEYDAVWEENTILTKTEIEKVWQNHIIPRVKQKWKVNEEKLSRQQQSILNDICLRAHIRKMEPEQLTEQFTEKLLELGLEDASVVLKTDILYYIKFLDPALSSRAALCLVGTKISDQAFTAISEKWPKVLGAAECIQVIQAKAVKDGCE